MRNRRLSTTLVGLLVLIAAVVLVAVVANRAADNARDRMEREASAALDLQSQTLEGVLAKYRHLPTMLAHRGDVRALFERRGSTSSALQAALIANDIAGVSGAADVAFLRPDGTLVAAARDVIKGRTGPLIQAPMQGRLGRTLLRTRRRTDSESHYVFSFPVRGTAPSAPARAGAPSASGTPGGPVTGIVAVAVGLDPLVETWSLALDAIWVSDEEGRLIVGNDRAANRDDATIVARRFLPQTRWWLAVGRDPAPVRRARRNAGFTGALIALLGAIILSGIAYRARNARARRRNERAQALRLERRVRDRTEELACANASLRAAQDELVQSAKLAALGRMSASLAHEYNQPLATIRTYADNAGKLLARDRPDEVVPILERVTAMAERMSTLSRTLRSFARTPGHDVQPVSLRAVVEDARLLIEPQAAQAGTAIEIDLPDIWVQGGPVRLSQVFVNLLSNAVDATYEVTHRRVAISAAIDDDHVTVLVTDTGPGIASADRPHIFDPFFTTRPVGDGLGLGLSIAYNIVRDFDGRLRLLDGTTTTFELTLRRAEPAEPAAEPARQLEHV